MAKKWVKVKLKKAPPGTYDPSLDMSRRAARRGLRDLLTDLNTQGTYSSSDRLLALGDINRSRTELGEDYKTARERTLEDVGLQRQGVERNYGRLANSQRQSFNAAGLSAGGAVQQAAEKRAANRLLEDTAIDTAEHRTLDDLLRQNTRAGTSLNRAVDQVNIPYGRGVTERETAARRGRREFTEYKSDLAETAMRQATESGSLKPEMRVRRKTARKWRRMGVI